MLGNDGEQFVIIEECKDPKSVSFVVENFPLKLTNNRYVEVVKWLVVRQ